MPHSPFHIDFRCARRGFTLFELMVVLAIAAVLATMVLPMMRDDDRIKLVAAASILQSDIEFAQSLSISRPDNRVAVKFDAPSGSYHVAAWSDVNTPIVRDDTGLPYVVTLGQGRATAAAGVTMTLTDVYRNTLLFDAHGGLDEFHLTPVITLQNGDEWIKLTIEPTTGTITESNGTGTPE